MSTIQLLTGQEVTPRMAELLQKARWSQLEAAEAVGLSLSFFRTLDCPVVIHECTGTKGKKRYVYIPADVLAWEQRRRRGSDLELAASRAGAA